MNHYEHSTPRAAIGFVAIAMTAITIGLFVVVPASMDPGNSGAITLAAAKASRAAPREVLISPARIDIVAIREPQVASAQDPGAAPRRKPQG